MDPAMANVVVTFRADGEEREALLSILGEYARLFFVSDLSPGGRTSKLSTADVLISWSPARELKSQDSKTLAQA
jgi:hypothetical protein